MEHRSITRPGKTTIARRLVNHRPMIMVAMFTTIVAMATFVFTDRYFDDPIISFMFAGIAMVAILPSIAWAALASDIGQGGRSVS